jgi:hydroxymethylpyrimidine pyrophosphatase-like HAD family hydrolase
VEKKFSNLFVFDLDGTLVHPNAQGGRSVPVGLQKCLHRLAETSHIVLATGRRLKTTQIVLADLPQIPFLICHNGLLIVEPPGEILWRKTMAFDVAMHSCEMLRNCGLSPILVMDGQREAIDFIVERRDFEEDENLILMEEKVGKALRVVESFSFLKEDEVKHLLEVCALSPYAPLLEAQSYLKTTLAPSMQALVVKTVGYLGLSVLEIFDGSISKWSGVQDVKSRLGVDQIISFGDDENDIEMLRNADVGVAMAHAEKHVLAASHLRVDGHLGLQQYLEKEWLD